MDVIVTQLDRQTKPTGGVAMRYIYWPAVSLMFWFPLLMLLWMAGEEVSTATWMLAGSLCGGQMMAAVYIVVRGYRWAAADKRNKVLPPVATHTKPWITYLSWLGLCVTTTAGAVFISGGMRTSNETSQTIGFVCLAAAAICGYFAIRDLLQTSDACNQDEAISTFEELVEVSTNIFSVTARNQAGINAAIFELQRRGLRIVRIDTGSKHPWCDHAVYIFVAPSPSPPPTDLPPAA